MDSFTYTHSCAEENTPGPQAGISCSKAAPHVCLSLCHTSAHCHNITFHLLSSFPLPKFKFEELQCNRRLSYLKENQVLLDVLTVCLPQLLMLTGKTTEGRARIKFPCELLMNNWKQVENRNERQNCLDAFRVQRRPHQIPPLVWFLIVGCSFSSTARLHRPHLPAAEHGRDPRQGCEQS